MSMYQDEYKKWLGADLIDFDKSYEHLGCPAGDAGRGRLGEDAGRYADGRDQLRQQTEGMDICKGCGGCPGGKWNKGPHL